MAAEFTLPVAKAALKKELGIPEDRPVVLIMGGGLGLGNVKDTLFELNNLSQEFAVIVVAGHNNELRQSLLRAAKDFSRQVIVLGYTDRIPELMALADLLITKPGGITLSEALVRELPMLLCQALPGQEKDNAAYLSGKGAALWVSDQKEFENKFEAVFSKLERLAEMKSAVKKLRRPQAAEDIAGIVGRNIILANSRP